MGNRQKIETSAKQLVHIFKHAPVGIVIYRGADFVIDLANEQALEMWGKELEEVQGRHITDVFPEIITTEYIKALHDASVEKFNKGESFIVKEAELSFQRNGNLHKGWYNYIHEPIKDSDGNVTGIIATAIEVTEQVLARKKIEDINRELEFSATVSDSIADAVISTSTQNEGYIITGWNKAAELMYGWKAEEVIGKPAREIITISSSEEQRKVWQTILDTNGFWKGEVVQKTKEGKKIHVLASVAYVKNKDGKILGTIGVNRDITEQREAEIALRESENRFRTLAEALPQMVWVRNTNGIIEYGSKEWERYSGIKNVSEAWREMLHPDEWDMIMERWEEDSKEGTPFRYEVRIKNKEGEYRWHYTAGEPVKDESGKVLKWIGALTDIHVQKTFSEKLEQEVAQRTEELVKANEELQSFNYIASHDLQEPLRKIQTFILLIEKHKKEEEITRKYFEKVKSSAQRMSELIQSILNYSRISKTGIDYNHIDLNKILDDVLTDFELLIKEKNAIIKNDKLPVIEANALQMHQLFSNLISNSLKFSKDTPRINIQAKIVTGDKVLTKELLNPKQQYIELIFSDNGIGFNQEYSEQIFQLFQRLHRKEEYSGTGIGLSIVKKIIVQHKGFVTTHSVLEKGTTFIIWLPVNHVKQ